MRAGCGFGSLNGVVMLFSDRTVLLAGWVHYVGVDLMLARWVPGQPPAPAPSRHRRRHVYCAGMDAWSPKTAIHV